jgi:hypothetical protein
VRFLFHCSPTPEFIKTLHAGSRVDAICCGSAFILHILVAEGKPETFCLRGEMNVAVEPRGKTSVNNDERLKEIKANYQKIIESNRDHMPAEVRKCLLELLKQGIELARSTHQSTTEAEACSILSYLLAESVPHEAINYAEKAIALLDDKNPELSELIAQANDAAARAYLLLGREIKSRQHRARAINLVKANPVSYSSVLRGFLYGETALADSAERTIRLEEVGGLDEWLNSLSVIRMSDLNPGFGDYVSNNRKFCREETERLRLLRHKLGAGLLKPENILLEAEPGSGKSFFVREFARQIPNAYFLERNLAAYSSLEGAFTDIILDMMLGLLSHPAVVLFVDEVDSELDGQFVFQRLIAPMNGDEFFFLQKQLSFKRHNLIAFYAMSSTSDEVRTRRKGEDFLSRIPQHHRIKLPSLSDPIDKIYRTVAVLSRPPFKYKRVEAAALLYVGARKWRSSRELEQALDLAKSRPLPDEQVLTLEHIAVSAEDVLDVQKVSNFDIFGYPQRVIEIG